MEVPQYTAILVGLFLFGYFFPWDRYPIVKFAFWCTAAVAFVARWVIKAYS